MRGASVPAVIKVYKFSKLCAVEALQTELGKLWSVPSQALHPTGVPYWHPMRPVETQFPSVRRYVREDWEALVQGKPAHTLARADAPPLAPSDVLVRHVMQASQVDQTFPWSCWCYRGPGCPPESLAHPRDPCAWWVEVPETDWTVDQPEALPVARVQRWREPETEADWARFWRHCAYYAETSWCLGYVVCHQRLREPKRVDTFYDAYLGYLLCSTQPAWPAYAQTNLGGGEYVPT